MSQETYETTGGPGESTRPRLSFLVTGASGGVGSAVARGLAQAGHAVWLASRPSERLDALAAELGAPVTALDAVDPEQVGSCVKAAAEGLGRLDGVAHCVGSLLLRPAHRTTFEQYRDVMATNLDSAFAVVAAAGAAMRRDGGSVVLVSSAAARTGMANHEAIAAAKAGVIGLTMSAAASYGRSGIRFNAVAPGLVQTPLTASLTANEAAAEASRSMHVAGRLGEPEDVAAMIRWLLLPESSWVTGQVFGVDGGLATVRPPAQMSVRR